MLNGHQLAIFLVPNYGPPKHHHAVFFLSNQGMTQMPRVELESVDAKLKSSGETMASWGLLKIIDSLQ